MSVIRVVCASGDGARRAKRHRDRAGVLDRQRAAGRAEVVDREAASGPRELAVSQSLVHETRDRAARRDGEPVVLVLDHAGARVRRRAVGKRLARRRTGSRRPCTRPTEPSGACTRRCWLPPTATAWEGTSWLVVRSTTCTGSAPVYGMSVTSVLVQLRELKTKKRGFVPVFWISAPSALDASAASVVRVGLDLVGDLPLPGDPDRPPKRWARRSRSRARRRGRDPERPGHERRRARRGRPDPAVRRASTEPPRSGAPRASASLAQRTSAMEAGERSHSLPKLAETAGITLLRTAHRTP